MAMTVVKGSGPVNGTPLVASWIQKIGDKAQHTGKLSHSAYCRLGGVATEAVESIETCANYLTPGQKRMNEKLLRSFY